MQFLAWYTLVWVLVLIAAGVIRSNVNGWVRLIDLVLTAPVLVFVLLYLLN
jgi:hypothetical protein